MYQLKIHTSANQPNGWFFYLAILPVPFVAPFVPDRSDAVPLILFVLQAKINDDATTATITLSFLNFFISYFSFLKVAITPLKWLYDSVRKLQDSNAELFIYNR
jgi:hypothetical protein